MVVLIFVVTDVVTWLLLLRLPVLLFLLLHVAAAAGLVGVGISSAPFIVGVFVVFPTAAFKEVIYIVVDAAAAATINSSTFVVTVTVSGKKKYCNYFI